MRKREQIKSEMKSFIDSNETLLIEVLLDIRDMLEKVLYPIHTVPSVPCSKCGENNYGGMYKNQPMCRQCIGFKV